MLADELLAARERRTKPSQRSMILVATVGGSLEVCHCGVGVAASGGEEAAKGKWAGTRREA